jgi:hypothetical protein
VTTKDQSFRMRMTEDEHAMLEALAVASRVSAAHVIRELIRRAHTTKLGGTAKRPATVKTGRAR